MNDVGSVADLLEAKEEDRTRITIVQEPPVGWFDVRQLIATIGKVLSSTIVGPMAGRRETLAALDDDPPGMPSVDHSAGTEPLWIDYVSDTGDGWNATASVAWLVGRDRLWLQANGQPTPQPVPASAMSEDVMPPCGGAAVELEAGQIFIFGGDQIYPTASLESYQSHLVDPYRSARFNDFRKDRQVFAIPGNHDWYGGLSGFIQLFCQGRRPEGGRWFGAWRTQQRRSYFSIKLPHGWWLWGVDLALDVDLDPPQVAYFRAMAEQLQSSDRVILCTPEPVWIESHDAAAAAQPKAKNAWDKAAIIEKMIAGKGARVALFLAGDLHHYAHYSGKRPDGSDCHYVTCGSGGAFLLGTNELPDRLDLPNSDVAIRRKAADFPSAEKSKRLGAGVLKFPIICRPFTAAVSGLLLLLMWFVHHNSRIDAALTRDDAEPTRTWIQFLVDTPVSMTGFATAIAPRLLSLIGEAPWTMIYTALVLVGFTAFADSSRNRSRNRGWALAAGLAHGLVQILIATVMTWVAVRLVLQTAGAGPIGWVPMIAADVVAFILAYGVCGFAFGLYLCLANTLIGAHQQETFSSQAIEDFKGFLRIKIERDQATIYPIGLRKVARKWKPAPGVEQISSTLTAFLGRSVVIETPKKVLRLFDPAKELEPHLIEPSFTIH